MVHGIAARKVWGSTLYEGAFTLIVWGKIGMIGSISFTACYFSCHKIGNATHTEVPEANAVRNFPQGRNKKEVVSLKVTSKISVDQCVNP